MAALERKTVREQLLYLYARLVADARFGPGDLSVAKGHAAGYWPFVMRCYRRLLARQVSRLSAARENVKAGLNVDYCVCWGPREPLQGTGRRILVARAISHSRVRGESAHG